MIYFRHSLIILFMHMPQKYFFGFNIGIIDQVDQQLIDYIHK